MLKFSQKSFKFFIPHFKTWQPNLLLPNPRALNLGSKIAAKNKWKTRKRASVERNGKGCEPSRAKPSQLEPSWKFELGTDSSQVPMTRQSPIWVFKTEGVAYGCRKCFIPKITPSERHFLVGKRTAMASLETKLCTRFWYMYLEKGTCLQ